jgi:preprotein translocase subunit Sec61beta
MRKQRASAPAGGAGLIRYFDVDTHGPKMSPKFLMSMLVTIIILEVVLSIVIPR